MPRKSSKPEPWEGGSSDDQWEPEETFDDPDLMSGFDEAQRKKEPEGGSSKATSDALDENLASRKRGRRDKKKKIEEIEKPRGVDRGLQPEKILAAQLFNSSVFFLVKWQGCLELDVVPGKDLNQHYPDFVIQYYESCVPFSVRHKIGRVPRIAPELPPPPEEPQMPMDVSGDLVPPPMSMPTEEQPVDQSMPEMSLPDMSLPDVSTQQETQPMEVPVN